MSLLQRPTEGHWTVPLPAGCGFSVGLREPYLSAAPPLVKCQYFHCHLQGGSGLQLRLLDVWNLKMREESCRLSKIDDETKRRQLYEVLRADRSTASSRSKSVPVKVGEKLVEHWWERPEFAQKFIRCDRDPACDSCRQFNEQQLHLLKLRRKFPPIKHVLSDFCHRYAKLQLHKVKLPKKVRKDFFHGIQVRYAMYDVFSRRL